jgi:hypothetical protein
MGRYYNGDIEGKFWFGVQSSMVGERFGCYDNSTNYVLYYTEDLDACQEEIRRIEESLGDNKEKFDRFFDENNGYNDKMLAEYFGIDESDVVKLLSEYADLEFGKKLEKCMLDQGYCEFTAEL